MGTTPLRQNPDTDWAEPWRESSLPAPGSPEIPLDSALLRRCHPCPDAEIFVQARRPATALRTPTNSLFLFLPIYRGNHMLEPTTHSVSGRHTVTIHWHAQRHVRVRWRSLPRPGPSNGHPHCEDLSLHNLRPGILKSLISLKKPSSPLTSKLSHVGFSAWNTFLFFGQFHIYPAVLA